MVHWELLVRIAAGTLLGGVIGYERDLHGRPAGLRTHMIVGLAAATFMVISTHFVYAQHFEPGGLVTVDASRIAASIVSGMGFLAGGAILRTGLTVQGLTTAAALWLVGAIGMAAGSGMYVEAAFVTLLGVLALTILRRFEDKDTRKQQRRRIEVVLGPAGSARQIAARLRESGVAVSTLGYDRSVEADTRSLTLDVRLPSTLDIERLIELLEAQPEVRRVRVDQVF